METRPAQRAMAPSEFCIPVWINMSRSTEQYIHTSSAPHRLHVLQTICQDMKVFTGGNTTLDATDATQPRRNCSANTPVRSVIIVIPRADGLELPGRLLRQVCLLRVARRVLASKHCTHAHSAAQPMPIQETNTPSAAHLAIDPAFALQQELCKGGCLHPNILRCP